MARNIDEKAEIADIEIFDSYEGEVMGYEVKGSINPGPFVGVWDKVGKDWVRVAFETQECNGTQYATNSKRGEVAYQKKDLTRIQRRNREKATQKDMYTKAPVL